MRTAIRLLRLLGPFRWRIVAAVLLGAATIGSGVGLMGTAAYLIALAALQPSIADLQVAIVGVRFFGLSRGVFRYLERLVSHAMTLRLLGRLRVWFFRALEPLAPARTMEFAGTDLLTRAVTDVESLQRLMITAVAPPMVALLVAIGAASVIGIFAAELAWAFAAAFVAAAVCIPSGAAILGSRSEGALVRERTALASALTDGIQGMADLIAFGGGSRQRRLIEGLSLTTERTRMRAARIEALAAAGVTFATHAAVVLLLTLAVPMVREGRFTGVGLAVVCLVAVAAFEAVQPLPAAARGLAEQLEAADRVFAVLDAGPAVVDRADPSDGSRPGSDASVVFKGVSFVYPGSSREVLCDLDLAIADGRRAAVVGPSGAGKSTIASLLARFWDPSRGAILVGGRRLDTYPLNELSAFVGVLPQHTELFTGTIRDNLVLAAPDADQAALDLAAERAGLAEAVRELPDGWRTWVGEHGMQLSGGQRRRLAVARLMLREPRVAVLDEPTAGLDPITEHRVMDSLLELFSNRTTVVITHRLVAMNRFDEIVVLDGGRVVERGTHDELVGADGMYRALFEAQRAELML